MITPPIQYNELRVTGSSSTSEVAAIATLSFTITSPSLINADSIIVVNLPGLTYSRLPASSDCSYTVTSQTRTTCLFEVSGEKWVTQVNLTLPNMNLAANTSITLTLILRNAWAVTTLDNKAMTFLVGSTGASYVSQGMLSLSELNSG
jgi:hypothetical protein